MGGEVHHRAGAVLVDEPLEQRAVGHVADDQRRVAHRLPEPGAQVVEHHDALAAVAQLQHDVTADVAGAAGDQDGLGAHRV